MRMSAVGLDISDNAIRFMELAPGHERLRVVRYATLEYGGAETTEMRDRKKLKETLRTLAGEHDLLFADVSLPEAQAYLANMRIPRVASKEIRGAIELKLEEHVPIAAPDAIFDYAVVGGEDARRKDSIDVVVSVLPRAVVDDFIALFEGTGIVPRSFEFESHAIARAVVPAHDSGTFLVVDIGKLQTDVFVVAENLVQFSASLDIGGYYFTQAITKALSVSYDEAERLKIEQGFTGEDNAPVAAAITALMNDFKLRLLRHYAYWQSHHGEKFGGSIETVFLSGGGANLRGLKEFLATGLDAGVVIANPWVNVLSFEKDIPPLRCQQALSYTTAIGLALRSAAPGTSL